METLVLDFNYRPIDIFPLRKAIKKYFSGRAEILENYTDTEIGYTWKSGMTAPSVIRLLHFIQKERDYRRFQKLTRHNVLVRDNFQCQYCGCHLTTKNLSWDHVVPRVHGGKTTFLNIVSSCQKCNVKKGSRSLAECGMTLKKRPIAPKIVAGEIKHSIFQDLKKLPSEKWKNYIYFNAQLEE